MVDQSHAIEGKIEPMILSIVNCQVARAKALLVNQEELAELQEAGDVLGAHRSVMDAFHTDVAELLWDMRLDRGLPKDPLQAFRDSGYSDEITQSRGSGTAGSGYPG